MTIIYEINIHNLGNDIANNIGDSCLKNISEVGKFLHNPVLPSIRQKLVAHVSLSSEEKSEIIFAAINSANITTLNSSKPDLVLPPELNIIQIKDAITADSIFASSARKKNRKNLLDYCDKFLEDFSLASGSTDRAVIAAAKALIDGKTPQEANIILNAEITALKIEHMRQATLDHDRDNIEFKKPDGTIIKLNSSELTIENITEKTGIKLTGEQFEFIKTTQNQGLFCGQIPASIISKQINNSTLDPLEAVSQTINDPFSQVDLSIEGKVIIRNIAKSNIRDIDSENSSYISYEATKFSIETDITSLTETSFKPGLASSRIEPVIKYEVLTDNLPTLDTSPAISIGEESRQEYTKKRISEKSSRGELLSNDEILEVMSLARASGSSLEDYLEDKNLSKFVAISDVANRTKINPEISEGDIKSIISSHIPTIDSEELTTLAIASASKPRSASENSINLSLNLRSRLESFSQTISLTPKGTSSRSSNSSMLKK